MTLKFNYDAVFSPDGLARADQSLSPTGGRGKKGITFHLTQAELNDTNRPQERESKHIFALTIEECKPVRDYKIGEYTPLPVNVSFERVVTHVVDSFKNALQMQNNTKVKKVKKDFHQKKRGASYIFMGGGRGSVSQIPEAFTDLLNEKEEHVMTKMMYEEEAAYKKLDNKLKTWRKYLSTAPNEAVVSDSFWYMRFKLVQEKDSEEIRNFLMKRISKNYAQFFVETSGPFKDTFFRDYFNIVAQSAYYALFYACPKSRDSLTNEIKEDLLNEFSQLFGGVKITNPRKYYSTWYLDLGAGNILKIDESDLVEQKKIELPPINFKDQIDTKVVRVTHDLSCSPIITKYLISENYKTRNYVKGYKMKFSKLDYQPEEMEATFERYKEIAKEIDANMKASQIQAKKDENKLRTELKQMREENWRHLRRLSRRRDEELANGAHEYANYLVSMLKSRE